MTKMRTRRRCAVAAPVVAAMGMTVAAPMAAVQAAASSAEPELPAVMLVLDASGSMAEPAGNGRTRIQAADDAVGEVVAALPGDAQMGLRIFGGLTDDDSCESTRLEVPVGPGTASAVDDAVGAIEPLGDTPLADSIAAAAEDLPDAGPGMVVVVTDGEETCGGDPCEVAGRLVETGVDVRVDVVGFQVDDAARSQLRCIASAGEGTYVDAPNPDALTAQLKRLAVRGLRVFTPDGIPVDGAASAKDAPEIAEGRYLDELTGAEPKHYRVDVPDGRSLWAAVSATSELLAPTDAAHIEVEVLSSGGTACVGELGQFTGASSRGLPLSVSLVAPASELEDCGAGPYTIRVGQRRLSGDAPARATELVIGFERGVADVDRLPPAAGDDAWNVAAEVRGEAAPVIGSPNIASAPVLEPGRYSDTILIGEALFYSAQLDWGQQLVCEATFRADPVVSSGEFGATLPAARTHAFGPYRGELGGPEYTAGGDLYSGDQDVTWTATTPPVRYRNREETISRPASLAGLYYCVVKLAGDSAHAGVGEVPVELTVDVLGATGDGAPEYLTEATPEPETVTPSRQAPQDPAAAQTGTTAAGDGSGTGAWVLVAVLGGVIVAVTTWLLVARARRSGGMPPEQGPSGG